MTGTGHALSTPHAATLPPVVVVPAHPSPSGSVEIELTGLRNGVVAAVAFSTVACLVDRLGRAQPWLMLPSARLTALGVTMVVLDPAPGVVPVRWSATAVRLFGRALTERVGR